MFHNFELIFLREKWGTV